MATIAILNGATREGGNTDRLLAELVQAATLAGARVEHVLLREMRIADCTGCRTCLRENRCRIDDDMTGVRRILESAAAVVFASPLYWCEVTGLLKTCIDRLYFYHQPPHADLLRGKQALVVVPLGDRNVFYETEAVVTFFNRLLHSLDMPAVDMAFFGELMEEDAAAGRPADLTRARRLGEELALAIARTAGR